MFDEPYEAHPDCELPINDGVSGDEPSAEVPF